MNVTTRIAREAVRFKRGHVADRAVHHHARAAMHLQVALHDFAKHGVRQVAARVHHQHVAGLDLHHGLVDHQVVARSRLDRQRGAHQLAAAVVAVQARDALAARQVVAKVGRDDAGKRFKNGGGSNGGSRQLAGAGKDIGHDDLQFLGR
ncbi:hypothetical protein D3C73_909170 [compost metagenome]